VLALKRVEEKVDVEDPREAGGLDNTPQLDIQLFY